MAFVTVLTQAGEELLVDLIMNTVTSSTWYGGWGTGTTQAAKGDTTIETEASEARTGPITPTEAAADKIQWQWTQQCAGSGKTIANAGVLTLSTGGVLLIHGNFSGIALNVGDSIQFTTTLEIT